MVLLKKIDLDFNTHFTGKQMYVIKLVTFVIKRFKMLGTIKKRYTIFLNQRNFLANFVMHPSSTKELSNFTIKNCMKSERNKLKNVPFVIKHSLRLTNFKYTRDNITNFLHVKSASKVSKI